MNRYVNIDLTTRGVFNEAVRVWLTNMSYFDLKWSMRNMDEAIRGHL